MTIRVEPGQISAPKAKVFISYARKDLTFADQLAAALKNRGFQILMDRSDIYAFEDWWKRIEVLIEQSDTVVFILSPDAVKSTVALKEISYAASLNKRFAPIVHRQVNDGSVPSALLQLNLVFFEDQDQFESSADRLAEALQTNIKWIRQHTEFGEAARRWVDAGKAPGALLRSPALQEAERWLASRPPNAPEPSPHTHDFISLSRRAERRRQVLSALLLACPVIGALGWWQQNWLKELIFTRGVHAVTRSTELTFKAGDTFRECDRCPVMVVVPAGSFAMGSPDGEGHADERPQHNVTIAHPFAVSKFAITFDDWDTCVSAGGCAGFHPRDNEYGRGTRPVIRVAWSDAKNYTAWLSRITGKTYRLLSEAEFEYATRAGTTTRYPWGNDIKVNGVAMTNCVQCGSQWDIWRTAPVGSFAPNAFGLYDMLGNVSSWTEDCRHDNYIGAPRDGSPWYSESARACSVHVVRGASYITTKEFLSPVNRQLAPFAKSDAIGFRVARTLVSR